MKSIFVLFIFLFSFSGMADSFKPRYENFTYEQETTDYEIVRNRKGQKVLRVNIETGGVAACGGFNDFLWHHIPNATITKKMEFLSCSENEVVVHAKYYRVEECEMELTVNNLVFSEVIPSDCNFDEENASIIISN